MYTKTVEAKRKVLEALLLKASTKGAQRFIQQELDSLNCQKVSGV